MLSRRFIPPERFLTSSVERSVSVAQPRHRSTAPPAAHCPETVIAAERLQVFAASESGIERQLLRDPPEGVARRHGIGGRSENRDRASISPHATDDAANQRALAGAVGAEDAQAFSPEQL